MRNERLKSQPNIEIADIMASFVGDKMGSCLEDHARTPKVVHPLDSKVHSFCLSGLRNGNKNNFQIHTFAIRASPTTRCDLLLKRRAVCYPSRPFHVTICTSKRKGNGRLFMRASRSSGPLVPSSFASSFILWNAKSLNT
jgi:hypothetical protein